MQMSGFSNHGNLHYIFKASWLFLRLGEGERKVYRFDRIVLLRSEPSTSLLNREAMCRHFQSALLKKTADGNNYVKEGLFGKLISLRFLKQRRPHVTRRRTKSFGSQFLQNDIGRPH